MRTIDTFYFGEVTLRDCFDPESSLNGEEFVEVTDSNGNVIADIYDYDIDDINEDIIEDNILQFLTTFN